MITKDKVDTNIWDRAATEFMRRETRDSIVVCKIYGMDPVTGIYDVMMFKQKTLNDPVRFLFVRKQ